MRGLDIRTWGLLDWIGAACFAAAALIPAVNAALEDAPALSATMPAALSWSYLPLVLILVAFAVILYRSFAVRDPLAQSESHKMSEYAPRKEWRGPLVGPFQIVRDPPADFRLLPVHYSVDLDAPLPYVQALFYAVSFLPHGITLTQARLSLRLFGAAPLEAILLVNEDFPIDAKFAPIVVFRRNLSDSEIRNLPWKIGQETGSFELSAKATDGEKSLSYVINSHAIEGWVSKSRPPPEKPSGQPPSEPAQSVTEQPLRLTTLADGTIPLPEAARALYEVARSRKIYLAVAAERLSGSDERGDTTAGTPEDILNFMATYIGGKALLYGTRPPSEKKEPIMSDEAKRGTFESGALVLKGRRVYTDLAVSKSDLYRIIGALDSAEI